jgi:hypothetical protein
MKHALFRNSGLASGRAASPWPRPAADNSDKNFRGSKKTVKPMG